MTVSVLSGRVRRVQFWIFHFDHSLAMAPPASGKRLQPDVQRGRGYDEQALAADSVWKTYPKAGACLSVVPYWNLPHDFCSMWSCRSFLERSAHSR